MMRDQLALQRYLQRHIEPDLPPCPPEGREWQHALIIPAYREPATLLDTLAQLPEGCGRTLVILVLNRPESDRDHNANIQLRTACTQLIGQGSVSDGPRIGTLNRHSDLLVHDLEWCRGPLPTNQGVGLARKTGCDIALAWMAAGAITGQWISCTDADARLPADYFRRLEQAEANSVAAVFPFRHVATAKHSAYQATSLYELRLHHYVLGLAHAASPYAFHSLGSCLAVRARAYAHVRGFPKRAGAEDFYLLNKVAKLGPVRTLSGSCIALAARNSSRVPFGTGPAVAAIAGAERLLETPLFYHPATFSALRVLLQNLPALATHALEELHELLIRGGLNPALSQHSQQALEAMGAASALAHCRQHTSSQAQFLQQFHQWFDGFRTLKFLHALRDNGWPLQNLVELKSIEPCLWPAGSADDGEVEALLDSIRRHWCWTTDPH